MHLLALKSFEKVSRRLKERGMSLIKDQKEWVNPQNKINL